MTTREQRFNGGADGTTFTAANSSADGSDAVFVVIGGGTATYETTGAKEGTGLHVVNANGAAATIIGWDSTFTGLTFTARGYITFNADTTANGLSLVQVRTAAGSIGGLQLNTGRSLQCVYGGSGTAMPGSAYVITLGTRYRFEMVITPGTTSTSGSFRYMLYVDDSTTALVDVTVTGKDLRSQPVASFRWSKTGTAGDVDAVFDCIIAADDRATPFGPLVTTVDYVKAVTDPVAVTDLPAEQTLDLALTLTDSVGLTDSPTGAVIAGLAVTLTDTVGVADGVTAAAAKDLTVTITDSVGATDNTLATVTRPVTYYYGGAYDVEGYGGQQALNVVPLGPSRTPTLLVRVTAPSGAWCYLDQVGRVSGLSYSWTYPGGPSSAQWSLDVTPGAHIAALTQGSLVAIYRGTSLVWSGRVSGIDRGSPWRVSADGKGSLAVHEPVSTTGSLDAIVDAAIANGLPWTRPASLSTKTWSGGSGGSDLATTMLDQVLTDVLVQDGKRWTVTSGGVVSAVSDPTAVSLLLRADTVPPLVLGQYASEVTVTYQTSTGTYATVRVTNSAAAARFGRVAATLNMGYSVLTSTQATAAGQAYLDRRAPAMTLAGDLTLTRGQVVTASGGPVDLPLVRPGVVGRIQVLPLLRDALLVPTANVDILIGATTYNADEGTLQVSPINRAPSPGEVILGAAA